MVGVAAGAIFHEDVFGQEWERTKIMVPVMIQSHFFLRGREFQPYPKRPHPILLEYN